MISTETMGINLSITRSMVIDELQSYCLSSHHRLAYFYCDFKNSANTRHLFGSLIRQLAIQDQHSLDAVESLLGSKIGETNHSVTMKTLLEVLSSILGSDQSLCHTYVVVDALDESSDREKLLDTLATLRKMSNLRLNILVSSRIEHDICFAFDGLPTITMKEEDVSHDVEVYINHQLNKHPVLSKLQDNVKSNVISTLATGASGM